MFSKSLRISAMLAVIAGSAILSSSASAQIADQNSVQAPVVVAAPVADAAVTPATTGARLAPIGVTNKLQMAPVSVTSQQRDAGENVGRDRAMMGVGLAAVVVGLLVGSDIGLLFVIGGALIGLVGLFHYMQ